MFQKRPGDLSLLCCRTLATKADHFGSEYIGDELPFNMKTKTVHSLADVTSTWGTKPFHMHKTYDLVTLSESLFFAFDDHRQTRVEYEDEKN